MIVIAHPGHWITSVAYFAPVVGFLIWLAFITVRDRMGGDEPDEAVRGPDSVR